MNYSRFLRFVTCTALLSFSCLIPAGAQQITPFTTQPAPPPPAQQDSDTQAGAATPQTAENQTAPEPVRPNYELGPSDQILIRAPNAEELNNKTFRIEDDGTATLPLLGSVKIGGMTREKAEEDLTNRLKTYVRNPSVTITVVQFRSAPVFFVGQFQKPGIYPLQGRHTLVEMLATVGGLTANAGRRIKVTRKSEEGTIPLSSAVTDPASKTSSVEIGLVSLTQNINPAEDIELQPYDVVSVERAEEVYVAGAVGKGGAFPIGDRDYITVLQLLSQMGGLSGDAKGQKAVVLRQVLNTNRRAEIPIDINKMYTTEVNDFPLLPNDILYIPKKRSNSALLQRIETIAISAGISTGIYALIYR